MSDEDRKPKRWVLIDCPYCGGTHDVITAGDSKIIGCELAPKNGPSWAFAPGLLDIREVT